MGISGAGGHAGNAQPARFAVEIGPRTFQVIEVAQAGPLGDLPNQPIEQRLAPRQRDATQIVTVEVGEIEEVIGQDGGPFAGQGSCQCFGIGVAVRRDCREHTVDEQGGRRQDREDDRPETVRDRLRVYHGETKPLVDHYEERGLLRRVDGSGDADAVEADIRAAIDCS